MPRPKRPWFRFYVEATRDPKMRRLSPGQRWLWVAVLAAARESCCPGVLMVAHGVPFEEQDLADYAGMTVKEVARGMDLLAVLGMVGHDDQSNGAWSVPNWKERQYESDDVTVRTAKHRSNAVPKSFPGTPPETEA